jgi:hypothetical protein
MEAQRFRPLTEMRTNFASIVKWSGPFYDDVENEMAPF